MAEGGDAMSDRPVTAQDYLDSQVKIARLNAKIDSLWMTARERHCLRKAVAMLADDADREDGIARSQIAAVLSDVVDRIDSATRPDRAT